jgi:hypothetical protein
MYLDSRKTRRKIAIVIVAILCGFSRLAAAQDIPLPAQIHPWGKFEPGAWKIVRVYSESFNEQGNVAGTNISENKTTLLDLNEDSITLEIKVTVEVASKRFDKEPQTIRQGFHGEQQSTSIKIKEPTLGQVVIEDRKIPCQVREIESSNANGKTVSTIYYSTSVSPYILKRDSVTTDLEGKTTSETSISVIALDMPVKILGCLRGSAHLKAMQKTPKGTTVTLSVMCPEIPGGIVSHSSRELDTTGRLLRRSTMELVDFDTEPENDRTGAFSRKRSNRYRGK